MPWTVLVSNHGGANVFCLLHTHLDRNWGETCFLSNGYRASYSE